MRDLKRMTINQLLECLLSKEQCIEGIPQGDSTPFSENSTNIHEKICDSLGNLGYEKTGTEVMYNGQTGERLNGRVFIGPTYYLRLKHLVSDKMHARAAGKRTIMHHQPLEGKILDYSKKLTYSTEILIFKQIETLYKCCRH